MIEEIKQLLLAFAEEHGDRIDRVAFCQPTRDPIVVASNSRQQVSRSPISRDPELVWKNLVAYGAGQSDTFVVTTDDGGIACAIVPSGGTVLIQYRIGSQLGVFSVLAKRLATAIAELER